MERIYGPYLRKDGRKHIVIIGENGFRQTKSYPKYLLEQKIGRKLVGDETCDHDDGDFTNDSLDNLKILSRADNIRKSIPQKEMYYFYCPECGIYSKKEARTVRHNWNNKKTGPFCSRECAGKHNWRLQLNSKRSVEQKQIYISSSLKGKLMSTAKDKDHTVSIDQTVSHFLENSKIKSNGIREVPKAAYVEELERHGVSEDDIKRVQSAVDHTTTAAAYVALHDLETKISEASKDDLKNDEYRRNLSSTIRLPTFGGSTNITVNAENKDNIPTRGDNDGPKTKITYGRTGTKINTKGRINRDFHAEADARIRKALGVK